MTHKSDFWLSVQLSAFGAVAYSTRSSNDWKSVHKSIQKHYTFSLTYVNITWECTQLILSVFCLPWKCLGMRLGKIITLNFSPVKLLCYQSNQCAKECLLVLVNQIMCRSCFLVVWNYILHFPSSPHNVCTLTSSWWLTCTGSTLCIMQSHYKHKAHLQRTSCNMDSVFPWWLAALGWIHQHLNSQDDPNHNLPNTGFGSCSPVLEQMLYKRLCCVGWF